MHFFTLLLKQKNCTVVYSSKIEIHILRAKLSLLSTIAGVPRKHKRIQIMDTFFALAKKLGSKFFLADVMCRTVLMLCCFPYFLSWMLTTLATNHQILYVARYFTFLDIVLCVEF